MKPRLLSHAVFLLLILVLSLWLWQIQHQRDAAQPSTLGDLIGLSLNAIEKIEVNITPTQPIVMARQNKQWQILSPFHAPADPNAIKQLLDILYRPSQTHYPATEVNLKAARLDPPSLSVIYNNMTIHFGSTDPVQGLRYALIGNEVHLLLDDFIHHLTVSPERFCATPEKP